MSVPLSTLLAQVLVAHTIELDNEFERRFAEAGGGARVTSLVMWSNLLRFVGDGTSVGDLVAAVGLQKPRVLSALGGVERWRYVEIVPTRRSRAPGERRDGYGSARGLKDSSYVRLTPAGRRAVAIWPELQGEIARRWRDRLGATEVDGLEAELRQIVAAIDAALPDFVPIVGSANGMALDPPPRPRPVAAGTAGLGWLLAQTQMRYTLDFEAESGSSLPISENLLRVVDESGRARSRPSASCGDLERGDRDVSDAFRQDGLRGRRRRFIGDAAPSARRPQDGSSRRGTVGSMPGSRETGRPGAAAM